MRSLYSGGGGGALRQEGTDAMRALVVGGTGPTGPFIVRGLLERGYTVAIFHRGTHEVPEIPEAVEHVHGDPHFRETIDQALGRREFDLVIASYGRLRLLAEAMAGRADRFIAVGGFSVYRGALDPTRMHPAGMPIPVREDAPRVEQSSEQRFAALMSEAEEVVLQRHPGATIFRYPYVYGPHQLLPREWCVVRRLLDGRRRMILPDGGLSLTTHGYAENLAHAVLLAVDRPAIAAGRRYNCGDERQLSLAQIVEVIADALGRRIEIVSLPRSLATPTWPFALGGLPHRLLDLERVRVELGYRDVVPVEEALARTARWYAANPPEPGGEIERRLGDRFDYALEDELIDRFESFAASVGPIVEAASRDDHHPYAHPTEPGRLRDHRDR
ncbi:MAG: hypothetical protein R3F35_00930 [Myxococcota bacterium]